MQSSNHTIRMLCLLLPLGALVLQLLDAERARLTHELADLHRLHLDEPEHLGSHLLDAAAVEVLLRVVAHVDEHEVEVHLLEKVCRHRMADVEMWMWMEM
eukprot:7074945-Prymnesium_polylepis.1